MDHDNQRTQFEKPGELVKYRVHMGDGPNIFWIWYSFIRAAILYEIKVSDWTTVAKAIAVAYIIHYKDKPIQGVEFASGDEPKNIPDN